MVESYTMDEIHLYVDTAETQTAALGQFGNSYDLADASEGLFEIWNINLSLDFHPALAS